MNQDKIQAKNREAWRKYVGPPATGINAAIDAVLAAPFIACYYIGRLLK